MAGKKIPMTSPDGRPWVADSEAEAFELSSHGYSRDDDQPQPPPAEGAKNPEKPK